MPTLDYASTASAKPPPPRWFYWAGLALGILPAAAGLGITLLYTATWWSLLPAAGVLCILAGLLCLCLGAIFLAVYGRGQWRYGAIPKRRLSKQLALAALLLLANFPLGLTCMFLGLREMDKAQVTFVNETSTPVTAIILITNNTPTPAGDLPANSWRKVTIQLTPETEFKGTAKVGGTPTDFTIDPYPEAGPLRKTVRFQPSTRPVVE